MLDRFGLIRRLQHLRPAARRTALLYQRCQALGAIGMVDVGHVRGYSRTTACKSVRTAASMSSGEKTLPASPRKTHSYSIEYQRGPRAVRSSLKKAGDSRGHWLAV